MTEDQKGFYQWWRKQIIDKHEYPPLDNWTSYIFVLIFELLEWEDKLQGYNLLKDIQVYRRYSEEGSKTFPLSRNIILETIKSCR